MAMLTIDRAPSPAKLRAFGILLVVFVAVLGGLSGFRADRLKVAFEVWIVGGVLAAIYLLVPAVRRPMYVGYMCAAFPIGWTVSHALLAAVYYGVVTPIGLVLRLSGRDPLQQEFDAAAASYWIPYRRDGDIRRYFRQF